MPTSIVEFKNISKDYSKQSNVSQHLKSWRGLIDYLLGKKHTKVETFEALKDISFSLLKGESLGIIGLNGAGKSTLLHILSGTLKPTTGTIKINGKVTALLELGAGFNPEFTGKENVYLNASLLGLKTHEVDQIYPSIESFANIGGFINQPVKVYSSGMTVRLAFAVMANLNPDILIIDEALAVGDARFQLKCFTFLEEFRKKGGSLIIVSHDLNSIARLCENSLLLNKGRLVKIGRTLNVINEYSKIISEGTPNKTQDINIRKTTDPLDNQLSLHTKNEVDSLSYGGKLGLIKNVLINNSRTALIHTGNKFTISFNIISKSTVESPIFALRIRDYRGQEIYGTNSKLLNVTTPKLDNGDKLVVSFTQVANLGPGEYFISIGFTCYREDDLVVIHRLRECIKFEVLHEDRFFGISNCFSTILIEKE